MPSKSRLKHLRENAALAQSHRCYYCNLPVWDQDPLRFATTHELSHRQAMLLQCTAEHLQSRSEGGSDNSKNIVAACKYCNGQRHKRKRAPVPSSYRQFVVDRMRRDKWLAAILPKHFVIRELVSSTVCNT